MKNNIDYFDIIEKLYCEKNYDAKEISNKIGIPIREVKKYIKKYNLVRFWTDEKLELLKLLLSKKMFIKDIAKQLMLSEYQIKKKIKELKLIRIPRINKSKQKLVWGDKEERLLYFNYVIKLIKKTQLHTLKEFRIYPKKLIMQRFKALDLEVKRKEYWDIKILGVYRQIRNIDKMPEYLPFSRTYIMKRIRKYSK